MPPEARLPVHRESIVRTGRRGEPEKTVKRTTRTAGNPRRAAAEAEPQLDRLCGSRCLLIGLIAVASILLKGKQAALPPGAT